MEFIIQTLEEYGIGEKRVQSDTAQNAFNNLSEEDKEKIWFVISVIDGKEYNVDNNDVLYEITDDDF